MASSGKSESETVLDERDVEYLPLRMIVDKKTEMYVKFAKVMVIFQGPYTPKRGDAAVDVKNKFKYASRVISDDTYRSERVTVCRYDQTQEFYDYFKKESRKALEEGNNLLVVDATMSNQLQNSYYVALAHKMQYVLLIVPPIVPGNVKDSWPHKSQAASFREVGAPMPSATQFQHLFCAWYLHDVDSYELRHEAALYLQDCIRDVPEFKEMFSRVEIPGDKAKVDMDADTFSVKVTSKYFKLDEKLQDLAYCVTKIFNNQLFSMNQYFRSVDVLKNYGKMSKLIIAGFVVSPHMVAARVKLAYAQKNLWDMQDEIDENSKVPLVCPSDLFNKSKAEFADVVAKLICSKSNQTMINSGRTSHDPTENIPSFSKGRACHIVLAKAPSAPSRNVDFDVQFALRRQSKAGKDKMEAFDSERCVVRRIGKYWFIDLKEVLIVDGFFTSCVKPFPYENAINAVPKE